VKNMADDENENENGNGNEEKPAGDEGGDSEE
jgi:hypothetical protein